MPGRGAYSSARDRDDQATRSSKANRTFVTSGVLVANLRWRWTYYFNPRLPGLDPSRYHCIGQRAIHLPVKIIDHPAAKRPVNTYRKSMRAHHIDVHKLGSTGWLRAAVLGA